MVCTAHQCYLGDETGHVAHMEREEVHTRFFWWGNLRERDHIEGLGVDSRIIFKCIFKKWNGRHGLD